MPHIMNPPAGFIATANNTAFGHNLDNDLTNDFRTSEPGAIHYMGPNWSPSLRAGRLTRLMNAHLVSGAPVTKEDLQNWQNNTQSLAAELLVPHLLTAWENAKEPDAADALAALVSGDADGKLAEAVQRLSAWDFSHPTGIPEGYDSADIDGERGPVSATEAAHSVAATVYVNWRAELIRRTVATAMANLGLRHPYDGEKLKAIVYLLQQQPFTGAGASGIDFFPGDAALQPAERRDVLLLESLRGALDVLKGPKYEAAFGGSTDLDDYRWGKLKRVQVLDGWSGSVVIPPAGGFDHLASELRGISREGGSNIVNVSGFASGSSVASQGSNVFLTAFSPMYRMIYSSGDTAAGTGPVQGWSAIAGGGQTGDTESPYFASMFARYLTGDHYLLPRNETDVAAVADKVEVFGP